MGFSRFSAVWSVELAIFQVTLVPIDFATSVAMIHVSIIKGEHIEYDDWDSLKFQTAETIKY